MNGQGGARPPDSMRYREDVSVVPSHTASPAPAGARAGSLTRAVYRHRDLRRLFAPRSAAFVGVSTTPGSFGANTLGNFRNFSGAVSVVHPTASEIQGRPVYRSLADIPEAPDLVVLAVPRDAVEGLVVQCADRGVGGVVIYASGYHETGKPERSALQRRLVEIARAADMRLLGPNTMGFCNAGLGANASFMSPDIVIPAPRQDAIGLVCQSGAVGFGLFMANQRGVSISHVLTAGNSSDVDVADEIAFLAEDPSCTSIACLFEGLHDPDRLLQAGRIAADNDKPLIVFKIATGENSIPASEAHTRTRPGELAAYRRAFEEAGMIVVEDHDALIETAAFFAKAPRPASEGVFIFSSSGGGTIIAADKADEAGLALPQPNAELKAMLEAQVPEYGSTRNPCDVTATMGSNIAAAEACYDAIARDPAYGVVVMPFTTPSAMFAERARALGVAARRHGKFACTIWLSGWLEGTGVVDAEREPDVAVFRSARHCFAAIREWFKRERRRASATQDSNH